MILSILKFKIKNLNKKVFYKIVESIENLKFDTSVFKEKNGLMK